MNILRCSLSLWESSAHSFARGGERVVHGIPLRQEHFMFLTPLPKGEAYTKINFRRYLIFELCGGIII
jgi:hypothetical protein